MNGEPARNGFVRGLGGMETTTRKAQQAQDETPQSGSLAETRHLHEACSPFQFGQLLVGSGTGAR
jgi:hypothetical protein